MDRSESEQRVFELLLELGFEAADITEPDKVVGSSRKEPDFLHSKVAFEVKEIIPDSDQQTEIAYLKRQLIEHKMTREYSTPVPRTQFLADISDASKKFKNYPEHATVLIEDLHQWFPMKPAFDRLMFGDETLHIDTTTFKMVGRTWQKRALQFDLRQTVGTYIFARGFDTAIYHNLHAYDARKMPKELCEQIQLKGFDQHFFYYDENNRPTDMFLEGTR